MNPQFFAAGGKVLTLPAPPPTGDANLKGWWSADTNVDVTDTGSVKQLSASGHWTDRSASKALANAGGSSPIYYDGVYTASGLPSGKPAWHFDNASGGKGFFLGSMSLPNPFAVLILARVATWTTSTYFFDTNNGSGNVCVVGNFGSSPEIAMYNGSLSPTTTQMPVGQWHIITAVFNGASSKLQIDNLTEQTGNPGGGPASDIFFGKYGGGNANCLIGEIAAAIATGSVDSTSRALHKAWLANYGGITI